MLGQAFCVVLDSHSRLLCWVLPPGASVSERADSAEPPCQRGCQAALGERGDELNRHRGFSHRASSLLQGEQDAAEEVHPDSPLENISPRPSSSALVFFPSPVQCRDAVLVASSYCSSMCLPCNKINY